MPAALWGNARTYTEPKRLPENGSEVDWRKLVSVYDDHFRTGRWIFRGEVEARADGGLRPSLQRLVERYGLNEDEGRLERNLIRSFQRRAHNYLPIVPHLDDMLEWMALMRHYSAPTRLLDWTYSFFVAVYFACENVKVEEKKPCVVHALSTTKFLRPAKSSLAKVLSLRPEDIDNDDHVILQADGSSQSWEMFRRAMMRKPGERIPLVYPVNPFRLNDRLVIQQGVFTCPGDVSKSFRENLDAMDVDRYEVWIAGEKVPECLQQLHRMNMDRASLFPGLDGFAWSLNTRLAFPETLSEDRTPWPS